MVDDGDAGDSAGRIHAHHHLDGALRAGGRHGDGIAAGLTVHLDLVDVAQGAAGGAGRVGHGLGVLQRRFGEGGVVRVGHDCQHGLLGLLQVDLSDGAGRHAVDQAQQARHDDAGDEQRHRQRDDVLGVHIDLFLGLDFVAHFAAASFFSADFTTPKREGFTALSISATTRFMIMME